MMRLEQTYIICPASLYNWGVIFKKVAVRVRAAIRKVKMFLLKENNSYIWNLPSGP